MTLDSTRFDSSPDLDPTRRPDIFAIGERLSGIYEVQAVLGQGGMGQVFAAHDHMLARPVAIKASWPHVASTGLRDESRALAAMGSRVVPTMYGMGVHRGVAYCVMERLQGETLADHIHRRLQLGHMAIDEALCLLIGVARSLAEVHDAGLVHRDLKPTNIMLAPDDRTVLLDFGLFATYGSAGQESGLCGSPRYLAPEAITRSVRPGQEHLVDIYALGIIGYMLLTRRHPFADKNTNEILWKHVYQTPVMVRAFRAGIPAPLERLIHEMLAKEPMERPFSAHALAAELTAIRARLDGKAAAE